jgi:3-oxoacyl-[acyl-carrier-protein] synthase-3
VSAEWILKKTGVARRHVTTEPVEVMAARAARDALEPVGAPDLLIYAATTQRQTIPDTSVYVQRELKLGTIPSFTVHASCLSFLVGLHNAFALVSAGAFKRVLVVSAEIGSVGRDYEEPESAALVGDGAGAVVVEATPEGERSELLAYEMATWPEHEHLASIEGGGTRKHPNDPLTRPRDQLFHMDGLGIYKAARKRVAVVLGRVLHSAGVSREQLALTVPHQPSGPAVAALEHYGIPAERTVNIVAEYGNCISASIPMALAVADREGRLRRGEPVLIIGTGAGLSVGAAVLRW